MKIPFFKPYFTRNETKYIGQVKSLCGDGAFTRACHRWLENNTLSHKVLLTHSCTAALEMTALLLDIQPGDEIIMPSYTFVSTANAFVLRGAVPVFVDVRPDTFNINETLIEAAITPKTKAIVPVHYAGVGCEMDTILAIAKRYHLFVIEDAAQGVFASYKYKKLGSIGHLGAFSFHETKNIISGEGGALLINDSKWDELADIIREKGTDRSRFYRGLVDKYTWQHIGSSYLPNEITAAFLLAQLEEASLITQKRMLIWQTYHEAFSNLERDGYIRRPIIPAECEHNAHMYYIVLPDFAARTQVLNYLKEQQIYAVFHYVPLHSSPAGKKYGRVNGTCVYTDKIADTILRLPLYPDMSQAEVHYVIEKTIAAIHQLTAGADKLPDTIVSS